MRKQYTLYLDESETSTFSPKTGKPENPHFCMAGIIIDVDKIANLDSSVNNLKRTIWNDLPNPERFILHQMRISEAEKGRLDATKYPEYVRFSRNAQRKLFYAELKKVFAQNPDIAIVGSSIKLDDLKSFYSVGGKNKQDPYLVAIQLLLENYCHFLCAHDARGNIIYEYREQIGNEQLRDRFYHVKLMGSMYASKATAEKRLLGLDFATKSENISGLQVADFVPNGFARDHLGNSQSKYNIFSTLNHHRYDGGVGQPTRFGVKHMP